MQKLRWGMLGGGLGSMIGNIHRYAANLDHHYELIGGAFSQDIQRSHQLGEQLNLSQDRIYDDYITMIEKESQLSSDKRIQVITIVTPNNLHYPMAKAAIEKGFHVVIDKPVTCTLSEALQLKELLEQKKLSCCITYSFQGYPMIKEARSIIASNELGEIRKVSVEFPQGWLSDLKENQNHKQATWRMDRNQNGFFGTLADIGTHAFNLSEYVSQLTVKEILTDCTTLIPGRVLDDDSTIFLRFNNGAKGLLMASQALSGEQCNIKISVHGSEGSLIWEHEQPNLLKIKKPGKAMQVLSAGYDQPYLQSYTRSLCRTPAGHPGGFIEAFANHYKNFALSLTQHAAAEIDHPTIDDGIRCMAFLDAAKRSNNREWVNI